VESLHPDFKDFLNLLNSRGVDYLLVGGYAVGLHGYFRHTGDLDIWVRISETNAEKLVIVFKEFGFDVPGLSPELFLDEKRMTRIGREPVKIEILTKISGLDYDPAKAKSVVAEMSGISIPLISLADLRKNKLASGRLKDLADLENLPLPPEGKKSQGEPLTE
jgi:hypothetical protein